MDMRLTFSGNGLLDHVIVRWTSGVFMSATRRIRLIVWLGAIFLAVSPLIALGVLRGERHELVGITSAALIFSYLVVAGRWDLTCVALPYFFMAVCLLLGLRGHAYGGPLLCLSLVVTFWFIVRRPPSGQLLNLSFPLRGGTYYVAHGGKYLLLNNHHASRSQCHALDIVRLNWTGTRAFGVYPRRLVAYSIFGETVYSPCSGTVMAVVRDLPDLLPGEMDRKDAAGNHVVIRLDSHDIYIGLAHLMQGSVVVKPLDRVSAGCILGRVGNSGNTSEPHLHIHAKKGGRPDSMLDGEGIPMCFAGRWLVRNDIVRT